MAETTVKKLADVVGIPVDTLLTQMLQRMVLLIMLPCFVCWEVIRKTKHKKLWHTLKAERAAPPSHVAT